MSPHSVVHSSDDIEDEEEELRDVETDILKLFRKMNRVRTRKFPLEKIQSEIEAVRSLKSSFCISFLYISLCISFKPKASLGTKVDCKLWQSSCREVQGRPGEDDDQHDDEVRRGRPGAESHDRGTVHQPGQPPPADH